LSGGSVQPIEGRTPPTGKATLTGLTAQPLDAIGAPLTIPDEGMEGRVGVAVIVALRVGASVTGSTNGLACREGFCVRSTAARPVCGHGPTRASGAGDHTPDNR
jgi:hypothetical protein